MEASTAAPAAPADPPKVDTVYIVLEQVADDTWKVVDKVSATGQRAAISEVAQKPVAVEAAPDGTEHELVESTGPVKRMFVAVPSRSWKPIPAAFETKTQLKLG